MIDKLLTFIRGIVRPVITVAVALALVWGFIFIVIYKSMPEEVYTRIIDAVLTIAGMAIAFWFGQRKAGT